MMHSRSVLVAYFRSAFLPLVTELCSRSLDLEPFEIFDAVHSDDHLSSTRWGRRVLP